MDKLASLGIDLWSIVLYLVNTGVLLAVLTYFLYKPLMKFMDERRKKIKDSIEEAQSLRDEFAAELAKTQKEKEKVEAELREELQKLHKFTDQKRAELVKEMEAARADMMQKAQAEIDQKKEQLIKDAEADVKRLMSQIILQIVENQVPEEVIQGSIKDAWKHYKK